MDKAEGSPERETDMDKTRIEHLQTAAAETHTLMPQEAHSEGCAVSVSAGAVPGGRGEAGAVAERYLAWSGLKSPPAQEVMRLRAGNKAGSENEEGKAEEGGGSDEEGKPEDVGEPDEEMDRVLKESQEEREWREALEKDLARVAARAAADTEEAGGEPGAAGSPPAKNTSSEPAALVEMLKRERQLQQQLEEMEARYTSEKEKAETMTLAVHPHPPWRQPRGKSMVSFVNSHSNATICGRLT